MDNVAALAAAVIVIGAFSLLLRPPLLALVAPISIWLMLFIALVWQVAVILALVPIVPGVHLAEPFDAAFAAVVFAALSTLLSWLLALDTDDSYYAALVRRLVSRRRDVNRTRRPGLVIIQIDGLSHDVLQHQVEAGRVPLISRWLSRGLMRLEAWNTLLPSQTSASQAGILFGDNDAIPAFRWFDKDSGTLFVSNRPADAETLEARLVAAGHPGLLAKDGASIANLLSGGAPRSYLTLSTMRDPTQGIGRSRSYLSFFLSPYGFVHSIVLGVAEVAKEVFQARRARLAGIEPRLARGFPYPFLRAATNVLLRPMVTSLVIEEILRGTSIIYATYTDYDEVAHHSGPQRAESLDALDGVDRVLGSIARATADAPRPYHLVVLSDHGQTLGATFQQRYGRPLEELLRQLMGGTESVAAAVGELEQWRVLNSFVAELARARGTARITRGALRTRDRRRAQRARRAGGEPAAAQPESADLVVCASGNLALVYFPAITGRASLEAINDQHPDMVDALANHPGVGLVMVRSEAHGSLVIGHSGVHHLADGADRGRGPAGRVRRARRPGAGQARRDAQLRRPGVDQHARSQHRPGCRVRGADRLARRAGRAADRCIPAPSLRLGGRRRARRRAGGPCPAQALAARRRSREQRHRPRRARRGRGSMKASATFLGHSTVLLEMDGARVLTDPVLLDRVSILRRAVSSLPAELHRDVDVVVISHLHFDHLDLPSLRLLGTDTPIVVPRGAGRFMRARGFANVAELEVGRSVEIAGVSITATHAQHSGFRPPFGPNASAAGYVLEQGSEQVYFAGDTDVFPAMADLSGIDLALLPVWGWGPRLGPGHMNPERAAQALELIRPTAAVPIHWGTLWPLGLGRVTPHLLQRPSLDFAAAAEAHAPEVRVLLTPPGASVAIPR